MLQYSLHVHVYTHTLLRWNFLQTLFLTPLGYGYGSQVPVDKEIVVAGGFRDELEVRLSKAATQLSHMRANQEEADTRLVLHAVLSQLNSVHGCPRVSRFPHPTWTMLTHVDVVWYYEEMVIHTHRCSFQRTTGRFSNSSVTVSFINQSQHHANYTKSSSMCTSNCSQT